MGTFSEGAEEEIDKLRERLTAAEGVIAEAEKKLREVPCVVDEHAKLLCTPRCPFCLGAYAPGLTVGLWKCVTCGSFALPGHQKEGVK